jgi:integrase
LEALFILAIATGMRRGELLGLKWQDMNLQIGQLQVRRILTRVPSKLSGKGFIEAEPKTEKGRRNIAIPSFVIEALKQHRIKQLEAKLKAGADWQEHDYVFCTSIGTHLNPTRDVLDQLKLLLTKAGLPDIRFHDLRHSAATILLSMDVHPKIVQEILGHSQISMTMDTYSHVLPTMQKIAMNKLNEVFQG